MSWLLAPGGTNVCIMGLVYFAPFQAAHLLVKIEAGP